MLTVALGAVFLAAPYTRTADGVRVPVTGGTLMLQVRDAHTIRVATSAETGFFGREDMVTVPRSGAPTPFTVTAVPGGLVLQTSAMKAWVRNGDVTFTDLHDRPILAEAGRTVEPATVDGERTFHVRQRWRPNADESLYGLGQRSMGPLDIKGIDLDLWQRNTFVVVPFLVSSRGYGVFWNNPSYTRFGDLLRPVAIPAGQLYGADGKPGGLTASFYAGRAFERLVSTRPEATVDFPNAVSGSDGLGFPGLAPRPPQVGESGYQGAGSAPGTQRRRANPNAALDPALPGGDVSVRWEGSIEPRETGAYLFDAYSNGGIRLYVDGRLLIDHWRQSWLPEKDAVRVPLVKGRRAHVRLEWVKDQGANTFVFRWKTPTHDPATSLWSEVGRGVDYTFVYGPSLDRVIQGYRAITGRATMPPKWALGLWQSRQRYETQAQSLDVVDEYRRRGIPFDNVVQDWFYWKADAWGSHEFDPTRFPDPKGWIRAIHERHANLMISVWGKFYPGTKNFDALRSKGFLYEPNLAEGRKDWVNYPFTFFDPFTPASREMFWSQIDRELFKKGVDAWWMDASEPDLMSIPNLEGHRARMVPTGLGKPSRGIDLYALATARAVYEGQRKSAPDQRVFNLTRSGYAGQQRYGATTWSGDITSTWTALERQVPAGLGFSISGNPYWTMDTGGFSVPSRFASRSPKPEDLDEWRELNARWFQYATFVPLLRMHGEYPYRELWQFGGEDSPAGRSMLAFDRLRYRMMPYLYSLAGAATQEGGTFMRPLVMDYPDDPAVRDLQDEYLFGPAFLVSPVVHYKQRVRPVVLPKGLWYDFWTGRALPGGRTVDAAAPYERIPLHVRAGSIVPFGPELQYATEKKADPITLMVYTGADGRFTLYEDDGLTNGYERGEFARIPLSWSERTRTLTLGRRTGAFKGMLASRTFRIAFVSPDHPIPYTPSLATTKTLRYDGAAMTVKVTR